MKHLKIIGLAAIAAMALMAIGAASASADVLCKAEPNKNGECPTSPGDYASGTVFTAQSTNPVLTVQGSAIVATVTCGKSNVSLKNTGTGSNTPGVAVPGEVTSVTFTENCKTNGGIGCTVQESSGYTGSLKATNDSGAGTLTVTGGTETKVVCGGIFECKYKPKAAGVDLSFTGGNPAKQKATEQELEKTAGFGFGCGTGAKWDAEYTLNGANTAVWVATKME